VSADTVIMMLSNPTLARDVDTAFYALQVAEAELVALEKRLESNVLAQEASVAEYESRFQNASFRMLANESLLKKQVVSSLDAKETELLKKQLEVQLAIEKKRHAHLKVLQIAELDAKQAQINQARSQLKLQKELLADLQVTAGLTGVLQQVPVEQGQQIRTGEILARVAREDSLKAELRVQESQVRDVQIGQRVLVSAGGQQAEGQVQRIDPAVQNGVVIVDVSFGEQRLPSARPDLRVSGVIILEQLSNVLTLRRPVYSQENMLAQLYVLDPSGDSASLRAVQLGNGSVDKIEISSGLKPGDRVIVSDTSQLGRQAEISLR
jgi:HlyD family secretion protein